MTKTLGTATGLTARKRALAVGAMGFFFFSFASGSVVGRLRSHPPGAEGARLYIAQHYSCDLVPSSTPQAGLPHVRISVPAGQRVFIYSSSTDELEARTRSAEQIQRWPPPRRDLFDHSSRLLQGVGGPMTLLATVEVMFHDGPAKAVKVSGYKAKVAAIAIVAVVSGFYVGYSATHQPEPDFDSPVFQAVLNDKKLFQDWADDHRQRHAKEAGSQPSLGPQSP